MEISIDGGLNVTEEIIDRGEKLEDRISCLEEELDKEERLEDRVSCLEEEVEGLKERNTTLANYLNAAIEELNNVVDMLNKPYEIKVNSMNME